MIKVSITGMIVSLKTDLRFPYIGQQLLTTHDLSDIEKLCKRIIIIDDGKRCLIIIVVVRLLI